MRAALSVDSAMSSFSHKGSRPEGSGSYKEAIKTPRCTGAEGALAGDPSPPCFRAWGGLRRDRCIQRGAAEVEVSVSLPGASGPELTLPVF